MKALRISPVLLGLLPPLVGLSLMSCAIGPREEVIAGVPIPVPGGMSRAPDQNIELTIPGFGAGQAAYQGRVAPDELISFYQNEMPARGWRPNLSLVTRGGMLAYTRDRQSALIVVGRNDGITTLQVIVGATGP